MYVIETIRFLFSLTLLFNALPQVIDELLDVSVSKGKPGYLMASEIPLVLYDAEYEDLPFIYDAGILIVLLVAIFLYLYCHPC